MAAVTEAFATLASTLSAPRARRCLAIAILGLLSALGLSSAKANDVDGEWSDLYDWPLIPIHAALSPDGRVLTYGTNGAGLQTGFFIYDVWDPSAGPEAGHLTLDNLTGTDIFCSSHIVLPHTGDILIAGGDNWTGTRTTNTGNDDTNIFNPQSNTLTPSAAMLRARWYSTPTVLVNGEIYIQGGSGGVDFPEVRELNGHHRLLSGTPTSSLASLFPRNFIAPDGRVFGYDTNGKMYFVSPAGTGSIANAGQIPSTYMNWTSSAAMFQPGRILQVSGNSNGAAVIDISGPIPIVTPTSSLSSRRQWVNATLLPDGRVLATGGSEVENQLTGVNNSAEIWDPATSQWHVGSDGAVARLYHSSALLLPDATVLVAGGGAPGPLNNRNVEIYSPPYLFDGSQLATRPQILSAPDTADVGDTLAVEVDTADISRVTLVKTGAVTHSFNMDQRFVELPFTASENVLFAQLPSRASETPPGFYLLFVLNADGVPSLGRMVRINIDPTPDLSVDYTVTIGGGGGSPFQLTCPADQTLVGVHGRYTNIVHQIGAQCVAVNQFGEWIGDPANGPLTGTTTSGTSFTKTCPRDYAMSGFRGRAGQFVDQLDIECRALTSSGGLTGTGTYLGAVGGTGGAAQAPMSCSTSNPVYALYGRSGASMDSFGVLCRPAVITPVSVNSSPVIVNPGTQSSVVGEPVDLQIQATDADDDTLFFSASNLPPGLAIDALTGRITGTPTTLGSSQVIVTVDDGSSTAFAAFDWAVSEFPPLVVAPMPYQPPQPIGTSITYTASASGGLNVRFKWSFGDGTPETAFSPTPSVVHTFTEPGIYTVTLTVQDDVGSPIVQSFLQGIHLPLTANAPRSSTNIAYEVRAAGNARVWTVNQDNDSVSVFDALSNARLAEIPVGAAPRGVAVAPDGRVWVTNKLAAAISVIDPASLTVTQTIALPFASQPFGIVFSPVANEAFIVLEASGLLLKLDAFSGAQIAAVATGPHPRHVAIDSDGDTVYVSRFITPPQPGEDTANVQSSLNGLPVGGEIQVIDAANMTALGTIVLRHSDKPDFENQGSGVPNYLGAVAISPDGTLATVPSKQDNVGRGVLRNGSNLNFQNTVRAIASRIDLVAGAEDYARRIDLDNASVATAVVFDAHGLYQFVALETSREVAVVDVHQGVELFRFDVGMAPQGLALAADGSRLYVNNFMSRTLGVYDLTDLQENAEWNVPLIATVPTVGTERLSQQVLLGKRLFYDAADPRLARDAYLSCASCHNDGGHDGRVWDLTGFGEGLRNTIDLRGTGADDGRAHWSQNFDEIQDFEVQIRQLAGGTGLMSDAELNTGTRIEPLGEPKAGISADLDALAAYVASLTTQRSSPYRNSDGSPTGEAALGRAIFERENCAACHRGVEFTDSDDNILHDIGTLKAASGSRLSGPLLGIDTPTLRGVWDTAPYLHDGSAPTLADAVAAHNGVSLTDTDMSLLVAYLEQIDVYEAVAPGSALPFPIDLVAAYGFDEGSGGSVGDYTGNGNTGTIEGGATWTAGRYGNALRFDGVNDRVFVSASSSLNLGNEMTLSAWVQPSASQNGWRTIVQRERSAYHLNGSHLGTLRPAGGGTFGGTGKFAGAYSATTLQVGVWTHLAVTYNGSAVQLYVNGVLERTNAASGPVQSTDNPLWIGGNNPYGEYWNGLIDEVRIYNRALSPEEIQADMDTPLGSPPPADTEAPVVMIASPTASAAFETSVAVLDLSGTAADNVGVTVVTWSTGAGDSGSATGTDAWSVTGIVLQPGTNSITVTAADAAGNFGIDTLLVTYTTPPDTVAPVVTISAPTSDETYAADVDTLDLEGMAVDDVGVIAVTWTNGASGGSASGTGTWSVAGIVLQEGPNTITVTAADAAGNIGTDTLSVTYTPPPPPDVEAPVVAIESPTTTDTFGTSAGSLDLAGTATDNVWVDRVTWTNSLGGAGVASGTAAWSVTGIVLQPGANLITVVAEDAAGNTSTDALNVLYTPPPDAQDPVVTITSPTSAGTFETGNGLLGIAGTATDDVGVIEVSWSSSAGAGGLASGTETWSVANIVLQPGTNEIIVTAKDAAGHIATDTLTVSYTPTAAVGLVAAYGFDEGTGATVGDKTGNGNTGTIEGGATWTAGRYGNALRFDGVNDRVFVSASSSLNLGNEMTLSAWVQPSASQNGWRTIVQRERSAYHLNGSHLGTLRPAGGGTFGGTGKFAGAYSATTLQVGVWTHLAVTYNGSAVQLYVNGVLERTNAASGPVQSTDNPLWIGGNNPYGEYWNGLIDEVRIYNRALSPEEIQADMDTPLN